jgi:hypothetical protein
MSDRPRGVLRFFRTPAGLVVGAGLACGLAAGLFLIGDAVESAGPAAASGAAGMGAMAMPMSTTGSTAGTAGTTPATAAATTAAAKAAKAAKAEKKAGSKATASTGPAGLGGAAMAMPKGSWVSLDPVAEQAALKAFFATKPAPVTGNPVGVAEFHATCTVSHHGPDDPIVFPGQPGASHNHTFIGNKSTDAGSTESSLLAASTTCTPGQDHSAYWIPTLYQNGRRVDPTEVTVYYGSRLADSSRTVPFPPGFRMITGNAMTQTDTPDHQGNHFFCAGIGGTTGRTADGVMPVCAPTANLVRQVTFPDCWDGVHLDSPDHESHVSDMVNGACPARFPVAIPSISFVLSYPLSTNTSGVSLASGTTFSMHADFFNAWQPAALAERVRNCLDQHVKCNAQGGF